MALRRVGALWLKDGAKGKFMSGEIQLEGRDGPRLRVLVFKNNKKDKPKDPDYTINLADDDRKEAPGGQRPDSDEHPF